MKVLDKIKSGLLKMGLKGKVIGLSALAIGNVASIVSISVAWFSMRGSGVSNIDMVTGDVNVEIRSVTAYKQVYPYHAQSTEFINYDANPVLKKYVIKDHTLTDTDGTTLADDINFTTDSVQITLGDNASGQHVTGDYDGEGLNSRNIHCPTSIKFRYYIIGDSVFTGESKCWTTDNALAFANTEAIVGGQNPHSVVIDNVVISAGASFILIDKDLINQDKYLNYSSLDTDNSPFRIVSNSIKCLKSGAYKITYSYGKITIEPTQRSVRKDSIISNNSMDPTKINIDYIGSADKTNYPTVYDYVPNAIYNQNSMVVLDVELNYKNVNKIEAGLRVERSGEAEDINASISANGGYSNGLTHLSGNEALHASDFYCFYPVLTKTSVGTGEGTWTANQMWDSLHVKTNMGEEKDFLHIKHSGEWSDLNLYGKKMVNGEYTEFYREGVSLSKGDTFKINLNNGGTWRGFNDVKTNSYAFSCFDDDGTNDHNIYVNTSGLYDIYVSSTPENGKYIWLQQHETVIHISTDQGANWSDLPLIGKNLDTQSAEYYIQNVSLNEGDIFKADLHGVWRGATDIKSGGASTSFTDDDSGNHNIKVLTTGVYDIFIATNPDNNSKYIWLDNYSDEHIEPAPSVYALNLKRNDEWSTINLFANDGATEYFADGVLLDTDDLFNINLNDAEHLRNWNSVLVDDDTSTYFESGDSSNIKVKIAGSYDIRISVTPDENSKSITIKPHSVFSKFVNATGTQNYDTTLECNLHYKNDLDGLIINPSNVDNIYHCYIGIDYDYVFSRYFLHEKRLGKTYYLYRDYQFHFIGTQVLEQEE